MCLSHPLKKDGDGHHLPLSLQMGGLPSTSCIKGCDVGMPHMYIIYLYIYIYIYILILHFHLLKSVRGACHFHLLNRVR